MDASQILTALKNELSQRDFEHYISHLQFSEKQSKADYLVFVAPNEFMAKFIKTKFGEKIAYFYEAKSGNKAKINIISTNNDKLKHHKSTTKLDIVHIKAQSTILNPSFTFDNFVVGDSNKYAFTTCKAASDKDKLGKLYNPIFIYGSTGLGKTHLLQAVGNVCIELGKKVTYATSENFINDFTLHLKNHTLEKFKEKYKNCDALLIDDVQFFGKTDKIQEEFFHIFNEIHNQSGQIIMTSDKPPNMLTGITERLKTRFVNGIIADITPPELDTKKAIIQKKCEFNEIYLRQEVIDYIAASMGNNIREIEGMITNLNAHSKLINQEINLDLVKAVIKDHVKEMKENINFEDILNLVCREFNIKISDVQSNKKMKNIVMVRRIIIFLSRELTSISMPKLATYFDMKDHTAISHNIKKINELINKDLELKNKIDELRNKILVKSQQ
ncbi:chromosomal replication initiator protein DnaA [Campylobacter sp. LR264d]|uniref:chromosomal replication initiator protein DnaA n=1 Tax=Campylobacter sp. LR264d TaxID=2593544 RepID=UPI00123BA02B|nr:chromosomal replication initiator protein DnaA [Campylobacter sp. LR264d]KAA6231276.1 chromosomal replication initiator protein DnaA [Campylobacter sp. LR264d]